MITAQLINLGRNKINSVIKVKDKRALHKEISKHILSKGWDMEETKDNGTWKITAGWRTAGTVKILEQ